MKTYNTKNVSLCLATAAFILSALVSIISAPQDLSHSNPDNEIFVGVTNGGHQGG